MLKNIKWTAVLISVVYIVAGVLLVMYPSASADVICNIIGYALVLSGIVNIATYFMLDLKDSLFRNDFVIGIVLSLLGVLVIVEKDAFQTLIPFVLAIIIVASGFAKLQNAIDMMRLKVNKSWIQFVLALISIVFGLVIMFGKINGNDVLFTVIGVGLIYSGATDLYSTIYLSAKVKKYFKALEEAKHQQELKREGNVIDVPLENVAVENVSEEDQEEVK